MYHAADLLQLDYVRDTCSSYMVRNVERSNCVDLYKFADVFSVKIVMKACLQSIARNFTEIASSEEFCSLSVNQLTEILSHEELDVKEETGVWEAVVRWVQHSKEDRLQHLPIILPHIRFNLLTPYNMVTILDHPLVREDPGRSAIRNVVKEASNQKRRLGTDTLEMALLFPERSTDEMLWMNPGEDKYIKCQYDLSPLAGTVTRDNDIYILAEASQRNCVLFKYNHVQNNWEQMSKVPRVVVRDPHCPPMDHLLEIDGHLFTLSWQCLRCLRNTTISQISGTTVQGLPTTASAQRRQWCPAMITSTSSRGQTYLVTTQGKTSGAGKLHQTTFIKSTMLLPLERRSSALILTSTRLWCTTRRQTAGQSFQGGRTQLTTLKTSLSLYSRTSCMQW
ncbi:hypothetical protein Bbelb_149950 [Branchiostoma belcheri]|nr:hypothetical protein Bbelb_149950 [Branchiostoma belcheri]